MIDRAGVAVLFAVGLAALTVCLVPNLASDPHNDFVEYWAAGRLHVAGGDPYDPGQMLQTQRAVGWRVEFPMMMWNPPWTLAFAAPISELPFPVARGLWVVLATLIVLACARVLWRVHGGPPGREIWAVALAVAFAPFFVSLYWGQIGPLVLLGLTGFLACSHRGREGMAGGFLALATVKPHLVYLLWPALLVWSIRGRKWKTLFGLGAGVVALQAVVEVIRPGSLSEYLELTFRPPPSGPEFRHLQDWESPTFGWQLRLLFGREWFALQHVPTLLGLAWLAWHLWRAPKDWSWPERLPLLLLVSVATAAYGGWPADSLILLPAVILVAARLAGADDPRRSPALVAFLTLGALTLMIERGPTTEPYVWVVPAYLGLFVWLNRPPPFRPAWTGPAVSTTATGAVPARK